MYNSALLFNPSQAEDIQYLNGDNPETSSGWEYKRQYAGHTHQAGSFLKWEDEMKAVRRAGSVGNTAVIATNHLSRIMSLTGTNMMTNPQRYALIVLHVMGHNAGLDHSTKEKEAGNWFSPITTGSGLVRRINDGFSYDDVVFGSSKAAKVFRNFTKSYFNPYGWNGNPNNSLFLMDSIFKNNYLDLFLRFSKNDYKN